MSDTEKLEAFTNLGMKASFHHASDTGGEHYLAMNAENGARKLYKENPGLQDEMKQISQRFLWTLTDG